MKVENGFTAINLDASILEDDEMNDNSNILNDLKD